MQFFSGGEDQQLVLWDSVAHKSVWSSTLSGVVNSISVSVAAEDRQAGEGRSPIFFLRGGKFH